MVFDEALTGVLSHLPSRGRENTCCCNCLSPSLLAQSPQELLYTLLKNLGISALKSPLSLTDYLPHKTILKQTEILQFCLFKV